MVQYLALASHDNWFMLLKSFMLDKKYIVHEVTKDRSDLVMASASSTTVVDHELPFCMLQIGCPSCVDNRSRHDVPNCLINIFVHAFLLQPV
jgi:hypothetical protein